MAENTKGKKVVDSFTIRDTGDVVRAGDCVVIRPSMDDNDEPWFVVRVEKMETCCECRGVAARVRWYYRPWDTKHGKRIFHGQKELFLSDRFDTGSAHTFEIKCVVHTLEEYSKLSKAEPEDFFCRFEYKVASATFIPDIITVHCTCEIPYNPDLPMIVCPHCMERFHPSCVHVDIEHANNLDHFVCPICVRDNCSNELLNAYAPSPNIKHKNINVTRPSVIPGVPRHNAPVNKEDGITKKIEECNFGTRPRKVSRLDTSASHTNKSGDTSFDMTASGSDDTSFDTTASGSHDMSYDTTGSSTNKSYDTSLDMIASVTNKSDDTSLDTTARGTNKKDDTIENEIYISAEAKE